MRKVILTFFKYLVLLFLKYLVLLIIDQGMSLLI